MHTGALKWFNNVKGFGFNGGEDIFAHYSPCIQMDGYRTLDAGQQVNFCINIGPKGSHANLIIPIEDSLVKNTSTETVSQE